MEAVVVGLPDLTFGQKIAAVVKLKEESEVTVDELRAWCLDRIPKYQVGALMSETCQTLADCWWLAHLLGSGN